MNNACLVLEDGSVFRGHALGAPGHTDGEVVFSTSMTGYQEMLTDPSYAGQILVLTYPLIGNYGVNDGDVESRGIQVSGFVVREDCQVPSHPRASGRLQEYLRDNGVVAISGVDTRALTRRLRTAGVMMGTITTDETPEQALARLQSATRYGDVDFVKQVSTAESYAWESDQSRHHIVVVDGGVKYNILRLLRARGCRITTVPCTTPSWQIMELAPDGIVFSPGPGDPALLDYMVNTLNELLSEMVPIFGICLGHQVLARAFGARTYKLKFGHRGANHPVKDLLTGRIYITSQNHGYAVDGDRLRGGAEVSHVHLNDGTCEGISSNVLPVMSIQYHAEASPGPYDNTYLFDRFLEMVVAEKGFLS